MSSLWHLWPSDHPTDHSRIGLWPANFPSLKIASLPPHLKTMKKRKFGWLQFNSWTLPLMLVTTLTTFSHSTWRQFTLRESNILPSARWYSCHRRRYSLSRCNCFIISTIRIFETVLKFVSGIRSFVCSGSFRSSNGNVFSPENNVIGSC